jgi:hypothetical protein
MIANCSENTGQGRARRRPCPTGVRTRLIAAGSRLPRYMHDREAMLASVDRLEALERGGARIFFGHDPEFWRTVPQAPVPIA